ncbi:MAG: hypothetical protein WB646_06440 [Steroidobacteraceae bacterium]
MTAAVRATGLCTTLIMLLTLTACGGGDPPSSTASAGATSGSSGGSTGATADVLTYHYDNQRSGQNSHESVLTPDNVTAATFGLIRTLPADDPVDAAPLIASNVVVAGGTHNVVFVATENDSVYAYDADNGTLLQHVSLLGSGETASSPPYNCGQVQPKIGITSTPVIDRAQGPSGTLYVVAMSEDSSGNYHQRLHALDLATLADRIPATTISATASGTGSDSSSGILTFEPGHYKERGALLALNGIVYTVWASHCDVAPYSGWILAFDESSLARSATLDYVPNGSQGAIWNVAGLAADSAGALYAMAGNGTFDTTLTNTGFPVGGDFGNSVMKLTSTGTAISVADFYAASNTVSESNADRDLGSGSPMLLPDLTDASGTTRHLLIGAGKDGNVLLLDRDDLGKFNASADTIYQRLVGALSGGLFSAFAYYNGNVYVADVGGTLKAFSLTQAQLSASPTSQSSATFPYPGSSPSISANGTTNAILWALTSAPDSAAVLHAYNPANLAQEYYDSTQAAGGRDGFGNGEKYVTPVVANGKVFVGTPNGVAVFGLL